MLAGLEWLYLQNPVQRLWGEIAVISSGSDSVRAAAVYGSLAVRVRVGGASRVAIQSLDTLTDREFRGRGLFLKLARATFDRAGRDGVAFVYGFPNANSAPGFFGKLAWQPLDPLPFMIRPLRARYVAARVGGRLAAWTPDIPLFLSRAARDTRRQAQEIARFDERFTRLWQRFASGISVAVERDASYLNWRLVERPNCDYRRFAIYERGEPIAFIAFSLSEKHGGNVGAILELLHAPGKAAAGRRLLSIAIGELGERGADVLLAWCLPHSPNFSSYVRNGFVPFPVRFRPIDLFFGVRAFDERLSTVVCDRANWYVSYLDSDTA